MTLVGILATPSLMVVGAIVSALFVRRKTNAETAGTIATASKTHAEASEIEQRTMASVTKELTDFVAFQKHQLDDLMLRVDRLSQENQVLRRRVRTLELELGHDAPGTRYVAPAATTRHVDPDPTVAP